MVTKVYASAEEAVADIPDGATIMVGGFAGIGIPSTLLDALVQQGAKDLVVISNSIMEATELADAKRIKKLITSFPALPGRSNTFEQQYLAGEVELEMVPEGILPERIRAAGAGLAGFYSPTGIGTQIEVGKEKRIFDGKEYILELALSADFALIKGYIGDRLGNLVYRLVAQNINPTMAMAATTTIAEVEKIVEPGELDPSSVTTPSIFVDRIVQAPKRVRWFRLSRIVSR